MFNKTKKLGLAALLALGTIGSASATVLDTFNYDMDMYVDGQASSFMTLNLPAQSLDTSTQSVTFGQVDYTLNLTTDSVSGFGNNITTNATIIDQNLVFSAASGVSGDVELFYHNATLDLAPPGFGLDLVQGGINDSFYIDVVIADSGLDVMIDVTDMSDNVSTLLFNIAADISNTRLFLMFNNFIGTADFTDVKSVGAQIISGNSADFTLAEVGTIPEPTTLAIFGLGLIGLAFGSRRKA